MAEFKKLGAVEAVATVSDTASVLIEENGVIKRAPNDVIHPKPVLDIDVTLSYNQEEDTMIPEYTINKIDTYTNIKNRLFNGELQECIAKVSYQAWESSNSLYATEVFDGYITHCPANYDNSDAPEFLRFSFYGSNIGFFAVLKSDNVMQGVFLD